MRDDLKKVAHPEFQDKLDYVALKHNRGASEVAVTWLGESSLDQSCPLNCVGVYSQ